jgi:hypothetical protein
MAGGAFGGWLLTAMAFPSVLPRPLFGLRDEGGDGGLGTRPPPRRIGGVRERRRKSSKDSDGPAWPRRQDCTGIGAGAFDGLGTVDRERDGVFGAGMPAFGTGVPGAGVLSPAMYGVGVPAAGPKREGPGVPGAGREGPGVPGAGREKPPLMPGP